MRQIININENWRFWKDTSDISRQEGDQIISLPHTWNGLDGQDGGNDYFRGTCLYKKMLLKADLPQADQYYLEIRGANSSSLRMKQRLVMQISVILKFFRFNG